MKILHLVGVETDDGGVLSVLRNLQGATFKPAWKHSVWVNKDYRETRTPIMDYRYSRFAAGEPASNGLRVLAAFPSFLSIRSLIKREKFEIVHAHTRGTLPIAILIAKLMRLPVVFTNHNYASHPSLYGWASRQKGMFTVVLTQNMGRYYGVDLDSPNTRVIPACCSDGFFEEPLVQRETTFSPERPLRMVGLGALVEWKAWHTVCEAFDLLDPEERASLQFTHWGQGDEHYRSRLLEFIQTRGLTETVRLMGPTDQVAKVLTEADWLMHPAVNDPFPVALLEGLARGLPAFVSASGGPQEIVTPGLTGAVFEPGSAKDLAVKIREVLDSKTMIASPIQVRESVKKVSASEVASKYYDLYCEILNGTRSRSSVEAKQT